ncbi:putative UMP-CMP kinase [Cocos nucifera]|uniref:Enhancer of polycomb-like protein n=1 Tax=Cocos nucifera TaxID=13894 RepID=A0A8K0IGF8_COCNU|nr:putative UMP-CMP kinase [Cocos nucifera]
MRQHARSENRKIVRKLGEPAEGAAGEAEIGSMVFPFRAPPASMPSVGTRRSTRVFVPKAPAKATVAAASDGGPLARVLRSGKRLAVSDQTLEKKADGGDGEGVEWLRVLAGTGNPVDLRWWKGEEEKGDFGAEDEWREPAAPQSDEFLASANRRASMDSPQEKKFGIVYNRKRPRPLSDDTSPSHCGIGEKDSERDRRITESARGFAEKVGILGDDIWTGSRGSMVLSVLIDSCCSSSSLQFSRLLISVVSWMKKARVRFRQFAAFLLSELMSTAFSLNGVHFLPVRHCKNNVFFSNSVSACGLCNIYGAKQFIPLFSLNFSAIPFFFKSLHVTMLLGSQYLPGVFAKYALGLHTYFPVAVRFEEYDSHIPAETGFSGTEVVVSVIPAVKRNESHTALEVPKSVGRSAVIVHGSRLRRHRHQRKRSSSRHSRSRHPFAMNSRLGSLRSDQHRIGGFPEAKALSLRNSFVEPVHVKTIESCVSDFLSSKDDSDVSTPLGSREKNRKLSIMSPIERIKELKLALAEVKQNIDSAHCNANILVTVSDRCWREEGAHVMLESSHFKEWCIAVKVRGMTRYLHKAQDMRPCVVNRFTHAYMWSGEDGWKLEFCDKWDYLVFKELHMECHERNSQSAQDVPVRTIPLPRFREVSGYKDSATATFVRPDDYIRVMDDEVGRAVASDAPSYDMDSGDEEWLQHLNSCSSDVENNGFGHVSEETFEKIIFALEKDAYGSPNDIYDKERALDLCWDLGKRNMLVAVYDYWVEKRNQKCAALVKAFQYHVPTLRRAQFMQRPLFQKRRSIKRQRCQSGRGKPEFLLEDTKWLEVCGTLYYRNCEVGIFVYSRYHFLAKEGISHQRSSFITFVLGGPGSGKGTQCVKIAETFGFAHLSAGDLLRKEMSSDNENGLGSGSLFAGNNICMVALSRIITWLMVGVEPDLVLFFDCPEEEMVKRVLNRNQGRIDDNIETIKKRLKVFEKLNLPVINHYCAKGKVYKINAEGTVDEIFEKVRPLFASLRYAIGVKMAVVPYVTVRVHQVLVPLLV